MAAPQKPRLITVPVINGTLGSTNFPLDNVNATPLLTINTNNILYGMKNALGIEVLQLINYPSFNGEGEYQFIQLTAGTLSVLMGAGVLNSIQVVGVTGSSSPGPVGALPQYFYVNANAVVCMQQKTIAAYPLAVGLIQLIDQKASLVEFWVSLNYWTGTAAATYTNFAALITAFNQ